MNDVRVSIDLCVFINTTRARRRGGSRREGAARDSLRALKAHPEGMDRGRCGCVRRFVPFVLLNCARLAHCQTNVFYENLPDGMHDVLISRHGGLYITGFDSQRRVCPVLFASPNGGLRTVSEFAYNDYGRYTPSVLAAHDPHRLDQLYVLLYLHPDNLGLEQMSLYRLDVATGTRTLLAQSSSPFWPPTALVPRADGSIVVALGGLGPLLVYTKCDDTSCEPAVAVNSTASNTPGKGGVVEIEGRLCLVVGSTAVYGEGGRVVCELEDGSLERIAGGDATAPANPLLPTNASHDELTNPTLLAQGIAVKSGGFGILYVVTRQSANEYGYSQGSIHALARRAAAKGETCSGARCWEPPRLVVHSVSNPEGLAIDSATDRLYVVERNTLRGFSYETFNGDVLAFCARGVYDCSAAQNSGECVCAAGYGGSCCDIDFGAMYFGAYIAASASSPLAQFCFAAASFAVVVLLIRRLGRTESAMSPAKWLDDLREPLLGAGFGELVAASNQAPHAGSRGAMAPSRPTTLPACCTPPKLIHAAHSGSTSADVLLSTIDTLGDDLGSSLPQEPDDDVELINRAMGGGRSAHRATTPPHAFRFGGSSPTESDEHYDPFAAMMDVDAPHGPIRRSPSTDPRPTSGRRGGAG